MDSKIHTMIMSSILAFSLIAGTSTVFAQNDTGMTSGGGDMGMIKAQGDNMTQAQGDNMTQAQGGQMGMSQGQGEDDGDGDDKDDGDGDDKDDGDGDDKDKDN